MSNQIEAIFGASRDARAFADGYLDYLRTVLEGMDRDEIVDFVEVLRDARARDATVYFLGNGGSAATASHFVNDLVLGTRLRVRPFRAVALTDNVAVLTALANDYAYDDVFVRQLDSLLRSGDVVVAISVSGDSPNVVKAVAHARDRNAVTVALTGFDGGELRRIAAHGVHVPTNRGEYGPAEDAHMVLDHLVCAYLGSLCRAEEG